VKRDVAIDVATTTLGRAEGGGEREGSSRTVAPPWTSCARFLQSHSRLRPPRPSSR